MKSSVLLLVGLNFTHRGVMPSNGLLNELQFKIDESNLKKKAFSSLIQIIKWFKIRSKLEIKTKEMNARTTAGPIGPAVVRASKFIFQHVTQDRFCCILLH